MPGTIRFADYLGRAVFRGHFRARCRYPNDPNPGVAVKCCKGAFIFSALGNYAFWYIKYSRGLFGSFFAAMKRFLFGVTRRLPDKKGSLKLS